MKNWYQWLWSKVGGRPWTYIWRDIYHEAEWLIQTIWFTTGFVVGAFWSWKIALILWAVYTYGYINGHFFWGTPWVSGQRGGKNAR